LTFNRGTVVIYENFWLAAGGSLRDPGTFFFLIHASIKEMDFLEVPRLPANCRDKLVEEEQTDGDLFTGSLNLFGLALLENQTGSAQQVLNPTSVDSYCSQISEMTFSEFVDFL